jgi:hypothetical protein
VVGRRFSVRVYGSDPDSGDAELLQIVEMLENTFLDRRRVSLWAYSALPEPPDCSHRYARPNRRCGDRRQQNDRS